MISIIDKITIQVLKKNFYSLQLLVSLLYSNALNNICLLDFNVGVNLGVRVFCLSIVSVKKHISCMQ